MDNQRQFDTTYITSTEICRDLGITRSAITAARAKGVLPMPIVVKGVNLSIWKRKEVEDILSQWKAAILFRRGTHK